MGGTKVVAKTMFNAYKHQRNLDYSRAKVIKKAINITKRALPAEYAKHWVEFFSLGAVKKVAANTYKKRRFYRWFLFRPIRALYQQTPIVEVFTS